MKSKTYLIEKVAEVVKVLGNAPALPPRFIAHSEVLLELKKHISELHFEKNYDARNITRILKENGIKTTMKEVRTLIGENTTSSTRKYTKKS